MVDVSCSLATCNGIVQVCVLYCCSDLSGRELVAEMVYSFLLPEVEKQTLREKGE